MTEESRQINREGVVSSEKKETMNKKIRDTNLRQFTSLFNASTPSTSLSSVSFFLTKKNSIRFLAILIALGGFAVLCAWMFDIDVLKTLTAGGITMKFFTALGFLLSGIMLYFLVDYQQGEVQPAQLIITACALPLLLITSTFLIMSVVQIDTGIERLFIIEEASPGIGIQTLTITSAGIPGTPAIGTTVLFLLFFFSVISTLLRLKMLRPYLLFAGSIIALGGSLVFLGYLLGIESFHRLGLSTGNDIAIHSGVLFFFLGIGVWLLHTKGPAQEGDA